MAEARSAVHSIRVSSLHLDSISTRAKLRGPQIHGVDGGLVLVVPAPKYFLGLALKKFRHGWNHFQSAIWPAPVWAVLLAIATFVMISLQSPEGSWFKGGPLAATLWWIDDHVVGVFGITPYLPTSVRAIYIAAYIAMASIMVVALLQRYFMRILLNYQAWMYESKPSMLTMAWGLIMRSFFLGQREPLLYSFQSAMPRQPVPPLHKTIERYLQSIKPLISESAHQEQQEEATRFLHGDGKRLQRFLQLKSWFSGNYVSDWWEKYVYLRSRTPILINSNYYGMGFHDFIPTSNQNARAAGLVHNYMKFKMELDSEKLKPTLMKGAVPICMRQYERLFSTTRIPGRDTDVIKHLSESEAIHITVLYKGTFWRVNTFTDTGRALEAYQIQDKLDFISAAVGMFPPPSEGEANLPALTGIDRGQWAEIREMHFAEGLNRLSLDEIENSILLLNLDDHSPSTWTEIGSLTLHGNGNTRWCDKSFNVVVYANGEAAVHAEHSWADAPVIAHAWEWVLLTEYLSPTYDKEGNCVRPEALAIKPPPQKSPPLGPGLTRKPSIPGKSKLLADGLTVPSKLEWSLWPDLTDMIMEAAKETATLSSDLELVIDVYHQDKGGYGKGFMKKMRCGPDAWIQLALQLAYYRDQGALHLTYESAAVRLFNEGRTETIRAVTSESKAAVLTIADARASKEDKRAAVKRSALRHQAVSRDAGSGKGVDRHLFALYVAAQGVGVEAKFLKDFLGLGYKLSTSQIPQRQTEFKIDNDRLLSPSGGFGPVADDGYGVSYMMADDKRTFFHVSSKRSKTNTDSQRFKKAIWQALDDLREVFTD